MLRNCCSDTVKAALIIGGAIIVAVTIAVSASIYFSPFQTCLRVARSLEGDESTFEDRLNRVVRARALDAAGAPLD